MFRTAYGYVLKRMLPIVIADDAREDALLARRALQQCKVRNPVIVLGSGKACLDYFQGIAPYAERSLPCVLFIDMVMSPISGIEVLRLLQGMPAARGSILIMVSGLAEWRTINEGYRLGAHTFLVKPLTVADIIQMLNSVPALAVSEIAGGYEICLASSISTHGHLEPGRGKPAKIPPSIEA